MFNCFWCAPENASFLDQATAWLECGNCKMSRWCGYIEKETDNNRKD